MFDVGDRRRWPGRGVRGGVAGTRPGGGTAVALLEPGAPAPLPAGAPLEPRVVALSRASERIAHARRRLVAHASGRACAPYERMRIWHESVRREQRGGAGVRCRGCRRARTSATSPRTACCRAALLAAFAAAGGVLEPAQFQALEIDRAPRCGSRPAAARSRARLVVGADGAQSAVRHAAGLSATVRDYRQTAIVATVATARPHAATAWQRFMRDGTLAFLPLADGTSSIVWSADDELAARLGQLSDDGLQPGARPRF